jgi:hypothetical protein
VKKGRQTPLLYFLFDGRKIRRRQDLVVLADNHCLCLRAKSLKLRIFALCLAGALTMVQVFIGPDMYDFV